MKCVWLTGLVLATWASASMPGMQHTQPQHSQPQHSQMSGMAGDTLSQLKTLKGRAFDVAFAQAMIEHHQMALDMAQVELKQGRNPTIKRAAQAVMVGQTKEIKLMKTWLSTWKAAAPSGKMAFAQPMPGQVDRWFLTQMLPHHQGALDMSQLALKNSQSAQVKILARQIIAAQNKEITQYKSWLATLK